MLIKWAGGLAAFFKAFDKTAKICFRKQATGIKDDMESLCFSGYLGKTINLKVSGHGGEEWDHFEAWAAISSHSQLGTELIWRCCMLLERAKWAKVHAPTGSVPYPFPSLLVFWPNDVGSKQPFETRRDWSTNVPTHDLLWFTTPWNRTAKSMGKIFNTSVLEISLAGHHNVPSSDPRCWFWNLRISQCICWPGNLAWHSSWHVCVLVMAKAPVLKICQNTMKPKTSAAANDAAF